MSGAHQPTAVAVRDDRLTGLFTLPYLEELLKRDWAMAQREGRTKLTPKGVRKLGQLALRDIYQGLLKDVEAWLMTAPAAPPRAMVLIEDVDPESTPGTTTRRVRPRRWPGPASAEGRAPARDVLLWPEDQVDPG